VAKWTELFNEIMLPTAHKLGIKKYSYSRENPEEAKKRLLCSTPT